MIKRILFLTILTIFLLGCTTTGSETIKIGFIGPLSGDVAVYGEGALVGVELAMTELGLSHVELIIEDTKCDPKEAVNAMNKLINIDNVIAVVGELCSGATLAAAPVAEENGIVLISGASTSPVIAEAGDYIFRTIPSDALQGSFAAELIRESGFEKLAIFHTNEDYGLGLKNVVTQNFENLGGEVVATETTERGNVDLRTQLTKIAEAEPDIIFMAANSLDTAIAATQQIRELGIEAQLFGSEGLKQQDFLDGSGEAAEGMIFTAVGSGNADFIERFEAIHETFPPPFAAQSYDAFTALALVIQGGASNSEEIKDALYDISFEGASGSIDFDERGEVAGNYEVFIAENGEFVLQ